MTVPKLALFLCFTVILWWRAILSLLHFIFPSTSPSPPFLSGVMSSNPTSKAKGLTLFAHRIDEQLCNLLLTQLSSSLEEVEGGLSERWKPECRIFVLLIFYSLSLLSTAGTEHEHREHQGIICTPGMRTMNLSCHTSTTIITSIRSLFSTLQTHFSTTTPNTSLVSSQQLASSSSLISSGVQYHWQGLMMIMYLLCSYTLERGQCMALLQGWSQAPRDSLKHRMYRCLQVIHGHVVIILSLDYLLETAC